MGLEQQDSVEAEAVAVAESDAQAKINERLWILIGLTVVGLVLAYSLVPSPPIKQLTGKSPEYVTFYTNAYKAKVKSLRMKNALIGVVFLVILVVAKWLGLDASFHLS